MGRFIASLERKYDGLSVRDAVSTAACYSTSQSDYRFFDTDVPRAMFRSTREEMTKEMVFSLHCGDSKQ